LLYSSGFISGEPVVQEIAAVSLRDRVIAAAKDTFFSGAIRPGDPIVERNLARQMKVDPRRV
jgi:DNA-binding GntR family transcriptional regulator